MAKVQFKYYLHDQSSRHEFAESVYPQIKDKVSISEEDLCEIADRPFYEVELTCELDTETGNVTILSTNA